MNTNDQILDSREKRYFEILELQKRYRTIVVIKGNTPGKQKNPPLACFLVKLFAAMVIRIGFDSVTEFTDYDGYYIILANNNDPDCLKRQLVEYEKNHPLGRLIDLDVYSSSGKLSRPNPRKCYICGKNAFDCIRNNRHQPSAITKAYFDPISAYMESLIKKLIKEAVYDELDLEPKFGLVSKSSSGSHSDMEYGLMQRAYEAIEADLYRIFLTGFNASDRGGLLDVIRPIGREAEKKMLEATNNINAYKGLIFNLGIILAACGWILSGMREEQDVFMVVAAIAANITKELEGEPLTFGQLAFKEYGFKGARGEAERGYPNVQKALTKLRDLSWESRMSALVGLIAATEDTVLLKRSGSLDAYRIHQSRFQEIGVFDLKTVTELTNYSIKNNLSFGGSADLLIVACFMHRLKDKIMI